MTSETSPEASAPESAGVEPAEPDAYYEFQYGHGRMPFFMKLVWIAFLSFAAWYTVSFLLESLGTELGG